MSTNNEYDCDWFIRFFEAIPEDKWCIGTLTVPGFPSVHCAIGHCGLIGGNVDCWRDAPLARRLQFIFRRTLHCDVAVINDGQHDGFQQPHPKARILAALRHIKAKQEAAAEAFELRPLQLTPKESVTI